MPLPKSSISLSMTSASPSTLATPSPISRMTPTFCLAVAVLAPAICASISCTRSAISSLLTPRCHRRASSAASLARTLPSYTSLPTLMRIPPMSAGFSRERRVEPGTVDTGEAGLDVGRMSGGSGVALSTRAVCRRDRAAPAARKSARIGERAAAPGCGDAAATTCRTRAVVQRPSTRHRRNSSLAPLARFPGRLHQRPAGSRRATTRSCLAVSSARRR